MRNAFAAELLAMAEADARIVMLSGDIGNRLFDSFKSRFPDRFYNCGVAEANMIGVAAGLALSGMRPIAYTITPFMTLRAVEQVKLDVCYHRLPVIIAGVGAGLSYANLGPTHHSVEDIAFMRTFPGITIVCPADPVETRLALRAAVKEDGPLYLRLGKKGEPTVHENPPDFTLGRGLEMRMGSDVCILSTGTILPVAVSAADELMSRGFSAGLVSFHTVKPLDEELLTKAFSCHKVVIVMEEHGLAGGFSGFVAEWLADRPPFKARLLRAGMSDEFLHESGNQKYARGRFGLTAATIVERALAMLAIG